MKRCDACGAPIAAGAEWCYACRAPVLARGNALPGTGPARAPAEAPRQALFKSAGLGLMVGGGGLALLAFVLHWPAWVSGAGLLVLGLSNLAFRLARAAGYEVEDPDTDIDLLRDPNDPRGDRGPGWL